MKNEKKKVKSKILVAMGEIFPVFNFILYCFLIASRKKINPCQSIKEKFIRQVSRNSQIGFKAFRNWAKNNLNFFVIYNVSVSNSREVVVDSDCEMVGRVYVTPEHLQQPIYLFFNWMKSHTLFFLFFSIIVCVSFSVL